MNGEKKVLVAVHQSDNTDHGELELNNIDQYLDKACESISGPDSLREHLRNELKEHLEEAIEELLGEGSGGMSRDEATAAAIEGLGDADAISEGMRSVYAPAVTSMFVDEAMKWQAKRWNRMVTTGLLMLTAIGIGVTTFVLIFIIPKLQQLHQLSGAELPDALLWPISISKFVDSYLWLLVIGVVGAVVLFQWKFRSENKPLIRNVIGVGVSLVSVAFAVWILFWSLIHLLLWSIPIISEHYGV